MEKNNQALIILSLMFLASLSVIGYFIFQNYQLQQKVMEFAETPNEQTQNQTPTVITDQQPTSVTTQAPSPTTNPYPDWNTYTNQEYGFSISFPPEYDALDSENDLYGWEDAVVLLYKGGQAHDIPVEVWDSEAEYQQKYQNRLSELAVKPLNGKFVTFLDNTDNDMFEEIVDTFQQL